MVLNPLDAIQAQYSTDVTPKAVNNVNLTRITITGGIVVVLCVALFIKSQLVLNMYYEAESNPINISRSVSILNMIVALQAFIMGVQ